MYGTTFFKLQKQLCHGEKKKKLRLFIGNSSKWEMGERDVFQQNSIDRKADGEPKNMEGNWSIFCLWPVSEHFIVGSPQHSTKRNAKVEKLYSEVLQILKIAPKQDFINTLFVCFKIQVPQTSINGVAYYMDLVFGPGVLRIFLSFSACHGHLQ